MRKGNLSVPLAQFAAAAIAAGWTVFLLPRTGSIVWLAGNAVYAALTLIAAALYGWRCHNAATILATTGAAIFIGINVAVAILACTGGGACLEILAVTGFIIALQGAVIMAAGT